MSAYRALAASCSEVENVLRGHVARVHRSRRSSVRPLTATQPSHSNQCDTDDQRIPPPTPWHPQVSPATSQNSQDNTHSRRAADGASVSAKVPKARRSKSHVKHSSAQKDAVDSSQQDAALQAQHAGSTSDGVNHFGEERSSNAAVHTVSDDHPTTSNGAHVPDLVNNTTILPSLPTPSISASPSSRSALFSFNISTSPSPSPSHSSLPASSSAPSPTPLSPPSAPSPTFHPSPTSPSSTPLSPPSARPQHITVQKALNARLKSVASLTELRTILQQQHSNFNGYHCTTLMCRLSQLVDMRQVSPKEMRWMHGFLKQATVLSRKHVTSMEPPQLAALWHSVAKLQVFDSALLKRLQRLTLERMQEFNAKGLSLLVWSLARMQLKPKKEWMEAFYQVSSPLLSAFNVVELSTTIWALATLGARPPAAWRTLYLDCATSQFPAMGPQALATAAWAPASLGWKPPPAWSQALLRASRKNLADCTPQGMTMILWSIAKLRIRPGQDWLQHHLTLMCNHMEQYNAQDLAQSLHSLVRLNAPLGPPFREVFLQCSLQQLPKASRQAAANLLWGLASLNWRPSPNWIHTFYQHFQVHMTDCKPADLANVMWALARLSLQPKPAFLQAVLACAHTQSLFFQPQEITTLVWAFAKLGWQPTDELLLRLFASTQGRMRQFQPQQLTNFLWAVAVLRKKPTDEWMKELYATSSSKWASYTPQGLTVTLWSVAQLKVHPPAEWLLSAADCCSQRLHEFNALDLSLLVRALQTLMIQPNAPDRDLMGLLVDSLDRLGGMEVANGAYTRYALQKLLDFTPQQLSNQKRSAPSGASAGAAAHGSASGVASPLANGSKLEGGESTDSATEQADSPTSSSSSDLILSPTATAWPVGTRYSSSLTQELIAAIANTSHSALEEAASLQQQGRTNSRVLTSLRTAARKQAAQLIVQTSAEMTLDLEGMMWNGEEAGSEWEVVKEADKVAVAGSA